MHRVSLQVKKSNIPSAGEGLFANRAIPSGTKVIEFKGKLLSFEDQVAIPPEKRGYIIQITNSIYLDCYDYANHPYACKCYASKANSPLETQFKANCRLVVCTRTRTCSLDAIRNIEAGEELMYPYNDNSYKMELFKK